MREQVYVLTGRVIPERAVLSVSEIPMLVSGGSDVPEGELGVEIILNQIFAKYLSQNEVTNIFTLRNIVEDAVRSIVDVAGYIHGYAYDVEIVQLTQPNTAMKQVFGIDVPVLAGVCEQAGINIHDVIGLLAQPSSYFVRHALADLRESVKSAKDTAFFCYRAVESLKNAFLVKYQASGDENTKWELFRTQYQIERDDIMSIKAFADPVRHGNYVDAKPMSDPERADFFRKTWGIVNKFVRAERQSPPAVAPLQ